MHEILFLGFDLHLLVQALDSALFESKDIEVIAKSSEKFVQMVLTAKNKYVRECFNPAIDTNQAPSWLNKASKVKLKFIDSCNFLASSLATLVDNLVKDNSPFFTLLEQAFPVMINDPDRMATKEDISYLLRKINFPYSYLTSPEVLVPGHQIPSRSHFDNDLTGEKISDSEWHLVQEMC